MTDILVYCVITEYNIVVIVLWVRFRVMVFNATFNNISVISRQSVLSVQGTGVPGENHRPFASH
jgi:hypothetical protein